MKKGRAPGIDEMCVDVVMAVGGEWNQMDKEAAECMYEAR